MLTAKSILAAYRQGAFPMAIDQQGKIGWFSPDPRALIPLDDRFHVSHGLRRVVKRGTFAIMFDDDFAAVIRACATVHGETWISEEIIQSYEELFREGYAHSVEVRQDGELVGGLYGVRLGGAFFGESMFHHVTNASKVALVGLVEQLRARGFVLLDTQWLTPHLRQFGTFLVPRKDYLELLQQALAMDCLF